MSKYYEVVGLDQKPAKEGWYMMQKTSGQSKEWYYTGDNWPVAQAHFAHWLRLIEHLPLSRDWISVEDRLPEKTGEYLAYDPNRYGKNKIDMFRFDDYNQSWSILSDAYHPTHWQHLPEPPKQ
jgi:hypothetical protein